MTLLYVPQPQKAQSPFAQYAAQFVFGAMQDKMQAQAIQEKELVDSVVRFHDEIWYNLSDQAQQDYWNSGRMPFLQSIAAKRGLQFFLGAHKIPSGTDAYKAQVIQTANAGGPSISDQTARYLELPSADAIEAMSVEDQKRLLTARDELANLPEDLRVARMTEWTALELNQQQLISAQNANKVFDKNQQLKEQETRASIASYYASVDASRSQRIVAEYTLGRTKKEDATTQAVDLHRLNMELADLIEKNDQWLADKVRLDSFGNLRSTLDTLNQGATTEQPFATTEDQGAFLARSALRLNETETAIQEELASDPNYALLYDAFIANVQNVRVRVKDPGLRLKTLKGLYDEFRLFTSRLPSMGNFQRAWAVEGNPSHVVDWALRSVVPEVYGAVRISQSDLGSVIQDATIAGAETSEQAWEWISDSVVQPDGTPYTRAQFDEAWNALYPERQ